MSKGLILKDSAHKTTLHKNARKYTQKNPINRYISANYKAFAAAKTKK